MLLVVCGCLSLCACELAPGQRDDDYVPLHPQYSSGLANPRHYMDKDDPNLQKLITSRYIQ